MSCDLKMGNLNVGYIEVDIKEFISCTDELAIKAEESKKMTFCIQAKILRKTAKEKEVGVKNLETEIENTTKIPKG